MSSARQLGYRGRQVLDYVTAEIQDGKRPPSYAMIADAIGVATTSDVCNIVRRLERRGFLTRTDTGTRHRRGWHKSVIALRTQST